MTQPGAENPFKRALEPLAPEEESRRARPFTREEGPPASIVKVGKLRTVAELNLVDRTVLDRTPQIRDLTVHDLEDLASEFSGIPTNNDRVASLTVEDIQDIEGVFFQFKMDTARKVSSVATKPTAGGGIDISCCCCTPCCCCAAADLSHTA